MALRVTAAMALCFLFSLVAIAHCIPLKEAGLATNASSAAVTAAEVHTVPDGEGLLLLPSIDDSVVPAEVEEAVEAVAEPDPDRSLPSSDVDLEEEELMDNKLQAAEGEQGDEKTEEQIDDDEDDGEAEEQEKTKKKNHDGVDEKKKKDKEKDKNKEKKKDKDKEKDKEKDKDKKKEKEKEKDKKKEKEKEKEKRKDKEKEKEKEKRKEKEKEKEKEKRKEKEEEEEKEKRKEKDKDKKKEEEMRKQIHCHSKNRDGDDSDDEDEQGKERWWRKKAISRSMFGHGRRSQREEAAKEEVKN